MKVLVAEEISEEAIELMKREGLQVDVKLGLKKEELRSIVHDYEAMIVRSQIKVDKDIIEAAKKLKIIGRAGVGVDNIDLETANRKGIIVVNAPGGNTISTAEHTIALLLSLARKIPQAHLSMKEKKWDRKRFTGIELRGKTIGVIGLGRVGFEVAKRCRALEMNVLAFDPYIPPERAHQIGVKLVDLETLLRESDIITLHVPKTKETTGMIKREHLDVMKKGVLIINTARGGIIDDKVLIEGLQSGKIGGVALDVYEKEPPEFSSPLFSFENVITTPHLGASTEEAQLSVGLIVAEDIVNFARGLPVKNAVNLPPIEPVEFEFIYPYMLLAEKMGKIASARIGGVIRNVKLIFGGKIAEKSTEFVVRALLKGLLEKSLGAGINLISAKKIAEERGIKVET
ncbi:MAG: phosphoglycerate dehydrogenase, partial [Archaeoglobaceae archaeon]|nr:phosphoglycerate dehydrogenase [Archaeoglobaceae archaeon]